MTPGPPEGLHQLSVFSEICKRNLSNHISQFDECISIFKTRCHPFLDAEIFTLGQLLDINKNISTYYNIIFKLERAERLN